MDASVGWRGHVVGKMDLSCCCLGRSQVPDLRLIPVRASAATPVRPGFKVPGARHRNFTKREVLFVAALAASPHLWRQRAVRRPRRRQHSENDRPVAASGIHGGRQESPPYPSGALQGSVYLDQRQPDLPQVFAFLKGLLPRHAVLIAGCASGGFAAFNFEPAPVSSRSGASLRLVLRLLTGGAVPGRMRVRWLPEVPVGATWLGVLGEGSSVETSLAALDEVLEDASFYFSLFSKRRNYYTREMLWELLPQDASDAERWMNLNDSSALVRALHSTIDWDALHQKGKVICKEQSVLGSASLIAGCAIGAGILALPTATQSCGGVPSTVALIFVWAYLVVTGLLTAEVSLAVMARYGRSATSLRSMAGKTIGTYGALVSSAVFVVVHLVKVMAFMSKGGELLASAAPGIAALPMPPTLTFAVACGGFVFAAKGSKLLEYVNNAFVLVIVAAFFVLVSILLPTASVGRFMAVSNWWQAIDAMPIMVLSLSYHVVVPTVCSQLEGDRSKITAAILSGSGLTCVLFLIWNLTFLASVPQGSLDPLSQLRATGSPLVSLSILAFSLSAIITSFVGFVIPLTDFFQDALRPAKCVGQGSDGLGLRKVRDFGLTLLPPLACALSRPAMFCQLLDKAGAYGDTLLFGLLPACMALALRRSEAPSLGEARRVLGGYSRGPLLPGGAPLLVLVGLFAVGLMLRTAYRDLLSR
ncbi:unnamed protein product [Polarella glacialis]|uniref:Amino acid transporter transmembrane domain-containing protein n=1 Tax=Polarella glacialis TaxID=89957 RepID=A0A813GT18_POLGL|nr:unnamed protein product [Polarella glacialis]CAE8735805.1 unnamed protein product [Polarella glacialis]